MLPTHVPGPLGTAVAHGYPDPYAVVDVETTGLSPKHDRIVQISISQMAPDGAVETHWTSLIDPERDPGPTHIHGITRRALRHAPTIGTVLPTIRSMLADRIIVAHNARFDWAFLDAEHRRASQDLSTSKRLCTIALTRRLDLPVQSFTLADVAKYWGVTQYRAHDAEDDVRVTVEIARHSLALCHRLSLQLPIASTAHSSRHPSTYPPNAPRTPCPWSYPGRLEADAPLRQGMTIAISGTTELPRTQLMTLATRAGLKVMNSVSGRTSCLVTNEPQSSRTKVRSAHTHQTMILSEPLFTSMLSAVQVGTPVGDPKQQKASRTSRSPRLDSADQSAKVGPLSNRRVLVLGGDHVIAAKTRERIGEAGGQPAVNLTASVTDCVALPGGDQDRRWPRIQELSIRMLDHETLRPSVVQSMDPLEDVTTKIPGRGDAAVLPRGGVADLDGDELHVLTVEWDHTRAASDVDVVAFVVDASGRVSTDEDMIFFNQTQHPSGAVDLELDTAGEATVSVVPALLRQGQSIVVAASLDGVGTFGTLGPMELALRDSQESLTVRSTQDAADDETSMLIARIYQRGVTWRFRSIGQGYKKSLADLARKHGVDVAG